MHTLLLCYLLKTQIYPHHPSFDGYPARSLDKTEFRKQSELCPHFLSRELLLPHVNTMLSLRIEML